MSFRNVVFAGGGSRCFWQVGFYAGLSERIELAPERVSAVSAGSAMACLIMAGRFREGVEHFVEATRANRANFYPRNLISRTAPAFPHLSMYRNAILTVMDETSFARLKQGPEIRVLLARQPRWLGQKIGAAIAFAVYLLERHTLGPVHTTFTRRIGYRPEVARAQDCPSIEDLADLILHSSCTPPFTPFFQRDGAPVLDGGAVDPVPMLALGDDIPGRTLVMLTSRYADERIPRRPDTLYVQPSGPIPITKWDYANPDGVRGAYELGLRDAAALSPALL
jgi:predicted acylesterase/phospholipase RssA